jgi:hypothetical protein
LLDQEPDPRVQENNIATVSGPPLDRAPNEAQAVKPSIIEPEAGQTVGVASVNLSAHAARNTAPPVMARNGEPITRLLDALSIMIVIAMVVVSLGLDKFLSRRTDAKGGLALGAMRLLQGPPDRERATYLSRQPPNEIEADPGAASLINSVKRTLDTIAQAQAETVSARLLRTPS